MAPLLLFILLIPLYLQANSQALSFEQAILLSLKQHWGNPPSLRLWNSSSLPCDLPEIECTPSGEVSGLYLAGRKISGKIPSSICQLYHLVSLDLSQNNISGYIPVCLSNCSSLEFLDLSLNVLSGIIPGEVFLMERLNHLSLEGNRLFGEIPRLIKAHSLMFLDLSDNHLNGSIPDDMMNLNNLVQLNLAMNSFSGTIPKGLFRMDQLLHLLLGCNNLSGLLPENFDLSILQVLNLTHNHLSGTIPRSLGEQTTLSTLDLSDNQLSGDITENLFYLQSMSTLSVCSNNFVGKIPYEFVNEKFDESCLDYSNLCSDYGSEGLPSCPSRLCSDDRFQRFLRCDQKHEREESKRYFVITMVETAGCVVVGLAILYYFVRKCWLKKHETSMKDEEEWKMISFGKLKFSKTDILSSLTDENLIGEGGSGKVYRIFINQTSNAVAVKSISNPQKSNGRLEKEFLAEVRTLGRIWHNNIVKLFCYISGKNVKLLVYQYFENKSLDQWLHGNNREISSVGGSSVTKLDWPKRLHIAIGIAQGLCYMHHDCYSPIVHRDIKSSNILLDSEFNAKIADFGLAKLLTLRGDTVTASAIAGTFGYIAPEYAKTRKLNTKIDVYSFGVVLLELTTGRKAVTRGDHMNLAERAKQYHGDTIAIADALDDEIKDSVYLDQIITVFQLGVICTATPPSNRPSMKDCLHILQNCSKSSSSSPNIQ